ncbi:phosphotransferase [Hoeflea sp. WL0058]|uniref:Phosphotransferase n=1 Tax=Flavimaribacter sediminis TaxID=2865987 RepID=A0AAE2ZPS2_9HYPH|nr:phosphotransferase [Flavimaribacter sediminis]MBW8638641.1 phosphotransferase [Flavimaribacter sediminis]
MTQQRAGSHGPAANADALIVKALEDGFGTTDFEIVAIERLDSHLHGHAFKYNQASGLVTGVYPYRIAWRDAHGVGQSVDVMLKAKPDERSILAVYSGLLEKAGVALQTPLETCLAHSDYSTPNLKEASLFRDFRQDLAPYLPRSLGVYIDEAASYTLRLEEILPKGSVILDPDDDTTALWKPGFSNLTLEGIAAIHARFRGRTDRLSETGWFPVCDTQTMMQGMELWRAFLGFLIKACSDVMTPDMAQRHRHVLDTLPDWYALVDREDKTLLYGDVNPQNLAFARSEAGFQLSLFDWERAVISLPQRDLAEHLVYTLPDDFDMPRAQKDIDVYMEAFARHAGSAEPPPSFEGLALMLQDLIVNRLPLMMIVDHVAGKRRHAGAAYGRAHRLLALFS